jgi:tRNA threonylcarbamoyladenosine biosynthesis protein TsaB
VAALEEGTISASVAHDSAQDYSSWLLPAVERVLRAAGTSLGDIELFAVAAGPGSFTALRVGLTSVKAWAELYGRPIVAVSRLEALAESAPPESSWVAPFVDARRAQIYAGLYRQAEPHGELLGEEEVLSPGAFLDRVNKEAAREPVTWVSLDPAVLEREPGWTERVARGESILLAEPMLAPAVGRIALRRSREGKVVNSLTLDANYVRRSDAEIFWKGGGAAHGK